MQRLLAITLLTGSGDGNARLWRVPPVAEGSVERVVLWVQVLTGSELGAPARRVLKGDDWLKRH